MSPPLRNVLWVVAAAGLAAAFAWEAWLRPVPRLVRTADAITRGRAVLGARCLTCHATIALAPRVAGWTMERAYEAIGRLPRLRPGMPAFAGSEAERRDLAVYLAALGAGEIPPP